jgi:hypothetical protein
MAPIMKLRSRTTGGPTLKRRKVKHFVPPSKSFRHPGVAGNPIDPQMVKRLKPVKFTTVLRGLGARGAVIAEAEAEAKEVKAADDPELVVDRVPQEEIDHHPV